jgi:glycerophosphoryl diester phosphodiesterase
VVFHDTDLQRMAARAERIADLDFPELRAIDLGNGAHAPLLSDVLDLVLRRGKRVNVEIKSDVPDLRALVAATAEALLARSKAERALLVVSSFEPNALRMLQQAAPSFAVGFLFSNAEQEQHAPELRNYGEHPRYSHVNKQTLQGFADRAGFVNVWTVNDPAEAKRLSALGVDGIISDVPDVIRSAV